MVITEKAQKKIDSTLNGEGFLRVSIQGGGCSGYRIGLDKEPLMQPEDVMLTETVLSDATSMGYLNDATLDWIEDPFQPTFKFDIPDTYACGCGSSFQFNES